jgi:ferrous iron transport protein B
MRRVILVGQPNVGKSTILNALTGANVRVANYPGTTVDIYRASALIDGIMYEFVDTPGIYNLYPSSLEEEVTERVILEWDYDAVVLIIDATAVERGLLLAVALAELGVPMIIAVNFWEEAERKGILIDYRGLEGELGVPVVKVNPLRRGGLRELVERLSEARPSSFEVVYDDHIEEAIREAAECVPEDARLSRRGLAVRLVEGDPLVCSAYCCPKAEEARRRLKASGHDPQRDVETTRAGYALSLASRHVRVVARPRRGRLDEAILSKPVLGALTSVTIVIAMIASTVVLAGRLIDAIDARAGPALSRLLSLLETRGFAGFATAKSLEALYAQYVAALPYVFIFYIFLVLLEDSGVLSRMVAWLHEFTRSIGLYSKAVIPILLGLGCSVPATTATRILPGRRQRVIAIAALAFVPCSSRASIIFGVAGRELGAWAPVAIYLLGFTLAILVAWALSKLLRAWEEALLVEDLPPLRTPRPSSVARKAWMRLKEFIAIVTPLVIGGAVIYAALDYWGLAARTLVVFKPIAGILRLPPETMIPIVYGFLQKDLVIAMLAAVTGTTHFSSVLTPHQIMTFTMASTYQVPCIIALGAMMRELGVRRALALWVILDSIGFAVAAIYAHLPL